MIKPPRKSRSRGLSATPPAAKEGSGAKPADTGPLAEIGRGLKEMFDDIAAEPVPERFRRLLDELERKPGKP